MKLSENWPTAAFLTSALFAATALQAQTVVNTTTFASGAPINATNPDSICRGEKSIWVEYGDDSVSTGGGNSTVVRYDMSGNVMTMYTIAGSVDGLKSDKGVIWALQNQDGNSTLTLINPSTGIIKGSPFSYAVPSATQGYDDVAFLDHQAFLSHTNPAAPTDAILQSMNALTEPIQVTDVLLAGATGTNMATGQTNQPLPDSDPDSLKAIKGAVMLTSGDSGSLIFVGNPGKKSQTVEFLQLTDSTGTPVSGLDDAVFATASSGTFYVSVTGSNEVLAIQVTGIPKDTLFASVGSLSAFCTVNMSTGVATPLVTGLSGPHGVLFLPQTTN